MHISYRSQARML